MKRKGTVSGKRWIMGKNCIGELAGREPKRIIRLLTAKPKPWEEDPLLRRLLALGVPIEQTDKQTLFKLVNSDSHQSYVAEVHPRPAASFKAFLEEAEEKSHSLVLAWDNVMDPQNVGALLRAAECFGVDAVLWSKNRGAAITPVVAKASVGATELIPILEISNLVEAARRLKEEGYWLVTAEVGKEALSLEEFVFPEKCLLILGGEGKGIQPLLSKEADARVYIPMRGRIDSLNVSQAAAVLLSRWPF